MFKLISLLLFLTIVQAGQDYYQLLGVHRGSSDDEIRKAFKRLSIKYHPDKNKGKEEWAQEEFSKVVNAYEVLKDPEQRGVYDRGGEEGLNQHYQQKQQQQHQQHGNWHDMFGHFNFGGQQQKFNLFGQNNDVYEMDLSNLSKFLRRNEVWAIYFYKNTQDSKNYKQLIEGLSTKFYGIFKVAAINCQAEEELCSDEFQVYDTPSIYVFPANSATESKRFNGRMEEQEVARFIVSFMESFVSIVTSSNYGSFVQQEPTKNILLLFTNKKSTPPLLKALSKDLKGKLIFGEVRETDKDLIQKFAITKFPTLMILSDVENYKGVIYENSDFKKDQIMKFLREYAYSSPKRKNKSDGELRQLTKQQFRNGQNHPNNFIIIGNCSPPDTNMCVLFITDGQISDEQYQILSNAANFYKEDPFKFYFAQKNTIIYSNVFPDISEFPQLVVIKPKKERYAVYQNQISNDPALRNFFDEVIGGTIQFKKMQNSLETNFLNTDL